MDPIREYHEKIESGEIVACEKIKLTYRKIIHDMDNPSEWHYSPSRASHIIEFVERFCRHSKGAWGGKKIKLELWEKAHLATVFGFIDDDGNRKYKEAVLIVGKKNGKSLLASAVGDYLLLADQEAGPEVYAVATTKDQAKIVWNEARRMVSASPALRELCRLHVADISSEQYNHGIFKPVASDVDTLDGLNVSGCLMDEFHQWKHGLDLYDIMSRGTSARSQPLIYMTSTAGVIREDIFDYKYNEAERVIQGYGDPAGYHDERRIFFIYELDKKSEWTDPSAWIKANPNLGVTKSADDLEAEVERAKSDSTLLKNLLCKDFNIRETTGEAWMSFEDINNPETFDVEEIKPSYYIGGVDLSSTTDLTAATALFKIPNDERLYTMQMYWIPEATLEKHIKEDRVPYDVWRDRGLLRTCPGYKVDYHMVTAWYSELRDKYGMYVYRVGYDAWSAQYFIDDMNAAFGKVMVPVRQGARTLSAPMKSLEADMKAKRVIYNNNPITKWCIANTAVEIDRNGNIAPIHPKQRAKRIDGLSSLLDAYVQYERVLEDYNNLI